MTNQDNLEMHSPNLVDENTSKIAELFPHCVTEAKDDNGNLKYAVDFDLLRQELSQSLVEGGQERYRLDWPGKRQAILEANTPIAKTLRPLREESVNFDTTENLFIEGDNLEALKLLQESYLGQVKMIYIDPPYNTGKDFIYEDNFAEDTSGFLQRSEQVDEGGNRLVTNTESNGRFHSDWLTMMYSRLKLSKQLLRSDGVIFISIGEREIDNLLRIVKEIFGESNFVTTFLRQRKKKPSFLHSNVGSMFEYVVCIAKNRSFAPPFSVEKTTAGKKFPFNNAGNSLGVLSFPAHSVTFTEKEARYEPQDMSEGNIITKLLDSIEVSNHLNMKPFRLEGEFRYSQTKLLEIVNKGDMITISKAPFRPNHVKAGGDIKKMHNLLTPDTYDSGTNEDGSFEIEELFGLTLFDHPKPTALIQVLCKSITYNDPTALVVDFFAGSSTTAHAIMQLNAEDKGNRKFIMVQLDEPIDPSQQKESYDFCINNSFKTNIAEISKERIRRAGKKVLEDNKDKEGIEDLDIGFRVLKIDSTNMKEVYYTPDEYSQAQLDILESHIKEDRTSEDLLFQVMLDWGVPLSLPIEVKEIQGHPVYYVGFNSLVACFDSLTPELVNEIAKDEPLKFVTSERAISHDQDKTNIKARFAQLSPETDVRFI